MPRAGPYQFPYAWCHVGLGCVLVILTNFLIHTVGGPPVGRIHVAYPNRPQSWPAPVEIKVGSRSVMLGAGSGPVFAATRAARDDLGRLKVGWLKSSLTALSGPPFLVRAAVVVVDDDVKYDDVIRVLDACLGAGLALLEVRAAAPIGPLPGPRL